MVVTMQYLLDTNICIYIAKKKPPEVLHRFSLLKPGDVGMSVVTYGELYTGITKSQYTETALLKLEQIVNIIPVQAMTTQVGRHYGEIRGSLEVAGTPMGNNDVWIAAHALDLNLILVSNNLREFNRVPNLKLENWATEV